MTAVYVTDFKPGTLTAQASRPQRTEASLVGQCGQGIGLIHELTQLTASEKVLYHGRQRLGIHQLLRRKHALCGVKQGHSFPNKPFRP